MSKIQRRFRFKPLKPERIEQLKVTPQKSLQFFISCVDLG